MESYQACLRNEPISEVGASITSSKYIISKDAFSIILIYEANIKVSIDMAKIHYFLPVECKFHG